jgi:LPS-assembly lipoprotein
MWCSEPQTRRVVALCCAAAFCAALAGCGFRPLHGEDSAARAVAGDIAYETPTDRIGYHMRRMLERRLGRAPADAQYLLVADVSLNDSGLAITEDSSITRYVVRGRSRYAMTGPEGFVPVSGFVESISAYSATGSLYATRAARRRAEERIAEDMGERIATRVSAELDNRAGDK